MKNSQDDKLGDASGIPLHQQKSQFANLQKKIEHYKSFIELGAYSI
jgi:hypothetical protein